MISPGGLQGILNAIGNVGDISDTNRRAIAIGNDNWAIAISAKELVIRADGVRLLGTVKRALGLIDVGAIQRGAQVFKTQAIGSERGGIGLNAHGGSLTTADADQTDARQLGNFLRQHGVREIFDFRKWQSF